MTAEWIVETPQVPKISDDFGKALIGGLFAGPTALLDLINACNNSDFSATVPLARFSQVVFANAACGRFSAGGIQPGAPFFGQIASAQGSGLIPLTSSNATPSSITGIGRMSATGKVLFPGVNGPNMVRVFQPNV